MYPHSRSALEPEYHSKCLKCSFYPHRLEVSYAIHQQHHPQCFATLQRASIKRCLRSATSSTGVWYIQSYITLHIRKPIGLRSGIFGSHKSGGATNIGVSLCSLQYSSVVWCAWCADTLLQEDFSLGSAAAVRRYAGKSLLCCKLTRHSMRQILLQLFKVSRFVETAVNWKWWRFSWTSVYLCSSVEGGYR